LGAGCSGRSARRSRAQATLEFAVVAPLFFLCLLATIDAGLWAVQNSAEVSAVEQGARDAASAAAGVAGGAQPDARAVAADITGRLRLALFGTQIVPWCAPAATSGCGSAACPASPAQVQAAFGPRVVAVCVEEALPPACARPGAGAAPTPRYCADTPMVSVRIVGYVASLVPPGVGIATEAGEVATDIGATTHTLRFAP
jgi:hypothetical protein